MSIPYLGELVLIALSGVICTVVLSRLRVPVVAGLLAAGMLLGPNGLALVKSEQRIETLAEVGVVLLLFSVGLEFSLRRLRHIVRQVVLGGLLQVGLTVGAVTGLSVLMGETAERSLFYGLAFALSSTAIVLQELSARGEIDAPHGRLVVGTLIFQDLCVIPIVLLLPLLAGKAPASASSGGWWQALLVASALIAGAILLGRWLLPRVLARVDRLRSREIFVLAVLGVCLGTAWMTSLLGLSLALGAFLGGMVLSESDFGHRALSDVLPLRAAFTSLFFISMGMLFDARVAIQQPALVGVLLLGLIAGKAAVAALAGLTLRLPARVAWLAGASLAQFSEFGFVVVAAGSRLGLIETPQTRALWCAGVLSMFLTPLVMRLAPHVTAGERLLRPLERLLGVRGMDEPVPEHSTLSGHVVVVGYGPGGQMLCQALSELGLPYLVLELNAETVRRARELGLPVYYGDATSPEALESAQVRRARLLTLLINDPAGARRVVDAVRRVAPELPILVRSRYLAEASSLRRLGVSDAVVEELESGMEMTARVLRRMGVARNLIVERIREARRATQESERPVVVPRPALGELGELADLKVETFLVRASAHACGRSPQELDLRSRSGALVLAVRRRGQVAQSAPEQRFEEGDVLFLLGEGPAVRTAIDILEHGEVSQPPPAAPPA